MSDFVTVRIPSRLRTRLKTEASKRGVTIYTMIADDFRRARRAERLQREAQKKLLILAEGKPKNGS